MKYRFYSVFDKKSGEFNTPFHCATDIHAIRHFAVQVQNKESFLNKWPEDFDLYYVGSFDNHDSAFTPATTPLVVLTSGNAHKKD